MFTIDCCILLENNQWNVLINLVDISPVNWSQKSVILIDILFLNVYVQPTLLVFLQLACFETARNFEVAVK